MKKGIVMEIDDNFLTLLTPEGQFLHAKKQGNCVLGEEIVFTPIMKGPLLNRLIGIKQLSAAAAVLIILMASLIPMYQNDKAYAYMSIDVQSSIEFGINKEMQVVKLTPYNTDGKKIIAHIGTWRKEDISSVTMAIIDEMKKQGYLKKNTAVVISTVQIEQQEEQAEKQLTKNIDEIEKIVKEDDLNLIVLSGTEKDMEEAHRLGITTGKYKEEMSHPAIKKDNQQPASKPKTEKSVKDVQNESSDSKSDHTAMSVIKHNTADETISKNEKKSAGEKKINISAGLPQKGKETPKQLPKKVYSEAKTVCKGEAEKKNEHNKGQIKKQEHSKEDNHHD